MSVRDAVGVSTAEVVWAANSIVDQHWRRPGQSWGAVCTRCTSDGCPALDEAELLLAGIRHRALS